MPSRSLSKDASTNRCQAGSTVYRTLPTSEISAFGAGEGVGCLGGDKAAVGAGDDGGHWIAFAFEVGRIIEVSQ